MKKLTEKEKAKVEALGVKHKIDPFLSTPAGLRAHAKALRMQADGVDKILAIIAPPKPKAPVTDIDGKPVK